VAQFEPKSLALTNRKHWHKLNRVIHFVPKSDLQSCGLVGFIK
jgi:hypothetical protein